MKKQTRQYLGPLCISAFAFLVGCAGDEVGFTVDALGQDSYNLLLEDVAPLETIEVERWETAFAGCEGLLDTVESYGVAEGQPELVVGIDVGRHIVCVDTYASVENELGMSSGDDVDALWLGYVATLQTLEADHTGMDPQTNAPGNPPSNDSEEPEPQTNDDGGEENCVEEAPIVAPVLDLDLDFVAGDPDPQPNLPPIVVGELTADDSQ